MLSRPPLFDELEGALAIFGSVHDVECHGEWRSSVRRTYKEASQGGTGPFTDVVDLRWLGTMTSTVAITGVAFLATATDLFWGKSVPASPAHPMSVALHAYAHEQCARASLTSSLGGAILPGVPVRCGADPAAACQVRSGRFETRRVTPLVQADEAALFVLAIEGTLTRVGRKRLWHLRREFASSLPFHLRELLTRRRAGAIRPYGSDPSQR